MKAFLRETLGIIIAAVVIFLLIQTTLQMADITYSSMEPSFHEGQRILVNKIVYNFHEPERGDVIVLHPPPPYSPDTTPFIKRIIGLPGELIEIVAGWVFIDGIKLEEPYIKESPTYNLRRQTIPENEYFVLGDNRNNSNDSHVFGTVPRDNIIGKAWISVWPLSDCGLIPSYSYME
ncbi:MAG: signal peptidase I [Dehalococcoidales bacterium]|nr:signal peptidase I [Dehalococcoidales bacterium]